MRSGFKFDLVSNTSFKLGPYLYFAALKEIGRIFFVYLFFCRLDGVAHTYDDLQIPCLHYPQTGCQWAVGSRCCSWRDPVEFFSFLPEGFRVYLWPIRDSFAVSICLFSMMSGCSSDLLEVLWFLLQNSWNDRLVQLRLFHPSLQNFRISKREKYRI